MRALSEFVVRVANLAEAEGRLLRQKVVEVISATLIWLGATILLVAGVLVLFAALYQGLKTQMAPHWALAITGLLPILLGGACFVLGKRKLQGSGK